MISASPFRKREQQQSKTHKREVENLKNEHKTAIKEHEQAQEKIKKEMEELQERCYFVIRVS